MPHFDTEGTLNRDYQKIIAALQIILENGVFERYFRSEGSIKDGVCALPLESGKIRLYCLRLSVALGEDLINVLEPSSIVSGYQPPQTHKQQYLSDVEPTNYCRHSKGKGKA